MDWATMTFRPASQAFEKKRSQYAPLIAESSGVMAQLVWADDQPLVSKHIIACLDRSEVH